MNSRVTERRDGEWWLRGLPAPRTGIEVPPEQKVVDIVVRVASLLAFFKLIDDAGILVALLGLMPLTCAECSLRYWWGRLRRTQTPRSVRVDALTFVPLVAAALYLLGAFGYPSDSWAARGLEIAGFALSVAFFFLILAERDRDSGLASIT
jgi:hypothetical protein